MQQYFKTQVVVCWGRVVVCLGFLIGSQTDLLVICRPLRNATKSEKRIKLFYVPSCPDSDVQKHALISDPVMQRMTSAS